MKIKYSQPDICKRDIDSVAQVLKGSSLTQGKKLLEFENTITEELFFFVIYIFILEKKYNNYFNILFYYLVKYYQKVTLKLRDLILK